MPISNPKSAKRQKQNMRQGLGAFRMGEQAYRSGRGPKGKKERQQGRCGTPRRKNSKGFDGEAKGYENDEKSITSMETREGEIPDQFERGINLRARRRRQSYQSRAN